MPNSESIENSTNINDKEFNRIAAAAIVAGGSTLAAMTANELELGQAVECGSLTIAVVALTYAGLKGWSKES